MSELTHQIPKINLFNKIKTALSDFLAIERVPTFTLNIPNNILYRTELICKYISDEQGYSFELENFIMILYLDFIRDSVKNYNPSKVLKLLSQTYYTSDTIIVSNGVDSCTVDRIDLNICNLTMTMEKSDVEKGQLILDEIYELYRYKFSFSRLLESLWLNFIDNYKSGDNKRAYHSIVNLLKKCFAEKNRT